MSLFKVTSPSGVRIDVNANHVVAVIDNGENQATTLVTVKDIYDVKESGRSVRGYVKKALAPVAAAAESAE